MVARISSLQRSTAIGRAPPAQTAGFADSAPRPTPVRVRESLRGRIVTKPASVSLQVSTSRQDSPECECRIMQPRKQERFSAAVHVEERNWFMRRKRM